jgi:hypothetical protein
MQVQCHPFWHALHLIRFLFENLSLLPKQLRSHHSPRLIPPNEAPNERTYCRADH